MTNASSAVAAGRVFKAERDVKPSMVKGWFPTAPCLCAGLALWEPIRGWVPG